MAAAVVVAAVVVVAVGAVVQRLELPAHRQLRAVVPQQVVAAVVAVAVTPIPIRFQHCVDLQLSHGFRSCHGQRPSMTTIKPMR